MNSEAKLFTATLNGVLHTINLNRNSVNLGGYFADSAGSTKKLRCAHASGVSPFLLVGREIINRSTRTARLFQGYPPGAPASRGLLESRLAQDLSAEVFAERFRLINHKSRRNVDEGNSRLGSQPILS